MPGSIDYALVRVNAGLHSTLARPRDLKQQVTRECWIIADNLLAYGEPNERKPLSRGMLMSLHVQSTHRLLNAVSVILFLVAFSGTVYAKAPLIQNIDHSPITSSQSLTMEDVEKAIIEGARVRGWQAQVLKPGHIEAVLYVRSHVAKVDIRFDTKNYSISYKDSVNLDYKNGRIHRNYNKWVMNLNSDIQSKIPY